MSCLLPGRRHRRLGRPDLQPSPSGAPFDLKDMALRQILCPKVQTLRSSQGLQIITQKVGDLDLIGDATRGAFRPHGVQGPPPAGIRSPARGQQPWHVGNPPPHPLEVRMERTVHGCHCLGKGLPALPAGQGTMPCPGTAAAHSGPHTPLQLHPRGSGGSFALIKRIHLPVHCHGQIFPLA
jgi:hypothetical protein